MTSQDDAPNYSPQPVGVNAGCQAGTERDGITGRLSRWTTDPDCVFGAPDRRSGAAGAAFARNRTLHPAVRRAQSPGAGRAKRGVRQGVLTAVQQALRETEARAATRADASAEARASSLGAGIDAGHCFAYRAGPDADTGAPDCAPVVHPGTTAKAAASGAREAPLQTAPPWGFRNATSIA